MPDFENDLTKPLAYVSSALNACQAFDILLVRWNRAMCLCFLELLRPVYPEEGILRINGAWPVSAGNGRFRGVSGKGRVRESAWDKA